MKVVITMKKSIRYGIIFTTSILILSLAGCKAKKPVSTDDINSGVVIDKPEKTVEIDPTKILQEFRNLTNKKNLNDVVKFVNENISKVDTIQADSMVYELEDLMSQLLDTELIKDEDSLELHSIETSDSFFPEDKIKDIKNEDLKKSIEQIYNNNYKLISLEGNYNKIIDYEKLENYTKHTSDEVKDYIKIKAMDSNKPVAKDGALTISYNDLADRLIKTEKYIMQYYGSKRHEELLKDYKNKIIIYLSGLPNTPIADLTSNKVHDDLIDSYRKTSKIKESSTAFVVNKYLSSIEDNNLIINKTIGNSVISLVNESLLLLEISK